MTRYGLVSRPAQTSFSRPEVVAHRGASSELPEHTLGAYRSAIRQGADAVECDVRLTADGHLVCVHDRRVDRTSSGSGAVSALELATLEGLDWASWHAGAAAEAELPDRDRGRLLTLHRLLDTVRDCGRPVKVAIETKHPTRYAGQVERALAEVLAEYGWDGRDGAGTPIRVMSFSTMALQRMRALAPTVPLVQLVNDRVPLRLRQGNLPRGIRIAGVNIAVLRSDPHYVRQWQQRGHRVHVFTVDELADLQLCQELGVDAVITNRPGPVLRALS
jgi:glycerophosphoryl diester phosphodiesterase